MNPSIYKSLLKLTQDEVVAKTKKLAQQERMILVEILHHLLVINDKKIYLQMGFKSLFDFCIKELGYSEGAAYRRIQAMRLLKEIPEVKQKVLSGSVNLTHLAQVQKVASVEKRQNQKVISKAQKIELLDKIENKSTRQSEVILREFSPLAVKPESHRIINSNQTEIKFIADQELLNKIEELKNLLSHKHVNPNFNELLHNITDLALVEVKRRKKILNTSGLKNVRRDHLMISNESKTDYSKECFKIHAKQAVQKQAVQKQAVQKQAVQKQAVQKQAVQKQAVQRKQITNKILNQRFTSAPKKPCGKVKYRNQRYIHPAIKNEAWFRGGGCCGFIDPKTKRKCGSKFQLEFDHIKPVAIGGMSTVDNIRLLCRAHNQFMAYKNNLNKY